MSAGYEAIVIGVGGAGAAALHALAVRGVRALGLDRFAPGHDRGSSHGETRIIRLAYTESPDYVPLIERSFTAWQQLEQARGEQLYHEVGLLQVGPPEGKVLGGVLRSAEEHGLTLDRLTAAEVERRFPGLRAPADEGLAAVFDPRAGYLRAEACWRGLVAEAERRGAEVRAGVTVRSWRAVGDGVEVETDQGTFAAGRLIVSGGAWAPGLLRELGISLEVRRKPLWWFEGDDPGYAPGACPCFLFELEQGVFYGFPRSGERGVKLARHSGGLRVRDPGCVPREPLAEEEERVRGFAARCVPRLGARREHSVCMYTLSPDEHFVLDRHPEHPRVAFAAGLSGHGFKMLPALGEALVGLVLEGESPLPVGFLGLDRPALREPVGEAGLVGASEGEV